VWAVDRDVAQSFRIERQTAITLELERCVPEHRFTLLGGYAMDQALALHDHREIYFINVGMGPPGGPNARVLVDRALRPGEPAYLINDDANGPWSFRWPGFEFRRIPGCPRVERIVRVAP
jgi:hypothetical protein